MREIKVMVFKGDVAKLSGTDFHDAAQADAFRRTNGMVVQQFAYTCSMQRDQVGTICGQPENVVLDFTVCVMQKQQNLFYEKLQDNGTDRYCFVFNAMFEDDNLKGFDNAILAEGYIVGVEERGTNDNEQAMMRVQLLASELTYLHKNNEKLILSISK